MHNLHPHHIKMSTWCAVCLLTSVLGSPCSSTTNTVSSMAVLGKHQDMLVAIVPAWVGPSWKVQAQSGTSEMCASHAMTACQTRRTSDDPAQPPLLLCPLLQPHTAARAVNKVAQTAGLEDQGHQAWGPDMALRHPRASAPHLSCPLHP